MQLERTYYGLEAAGCQNLILGFFVMSQIGERSTPTALRDTRHCQRTCSMDDSRIMIKDGQRWKPNLHR